MTKIFNISNVGTALLERHGLINQAVAVRGSLLEPGGSVEVELDPALSVELKHLIDVGVLAVGELPAGYAKPAIIAPAPSIAQVDVGAQASATLVSEESGKESGKRSKGKSDG